MRVFQYTYNRPVCTYAKAKQFFDARQGRSRTYTDGLKAVGLDVVGSRFDRARNTTLREEGGDMVMRYHQTDIIRISPSNIATVRLSGWRSRSTFQRVEQLLGLHLCNWGGASRVQYDNRCRIRVEGEYSRTVPFFDGMRIDLTTQEILPEDFAALQSDRRQAYRLPDKTVKAKLKAVWPQMQETALMLIKLGAWDETSRLGCTIRDLAERVLRDEPMDVEGLRACVGLKEGNHFWQRDAETIRADKIAALPRVHTELMLDMARATDGWEEKGGQLLVDGQYKYFRSSLDSSEAGEAL